MEIGLDARGSTKTGTSAPLSANGDFETFLKMLTAQIQNQDPLSPLEADEFASQLASFSMVEQQTLTNQKLDALLGSSSSIGNLAQFASIVGHVIAHDSAFQFNGASMQFEIDGQVSAESSTIAILDQEGRVVAEPGISQGATRVTWDGRDQSGDVVPLGTYSAELRSVSGEQKIQGQVLTEAEVEEVRITDAGAMFLLSDGTLVPESNIRALR